VRVLGRRSVSGRPYPRTRTGAATLIDGDLKIREFIFDKSVVAAAGNGQWDITQPPFNSWTAEITFVSAYGGSVTPTWKLARLSANTSSNLLIAERTNTNDLIITLGPLQSDDEARKNPPFSALQLTASAMNQHNVRWSWFPGQFGGKAKMDSGFDYAASFSSFSCIA